MEPPLVLSIRLFAELRERLGVPEIEVSLPQGATVGTLRKHLVSQHPAHATLIGLCTVAVDLSRARDEQPLVQGSEVALLPPVGGG